MTPQMTATDTEANLALTPEPRGCATPNAPLIHVIRHMEDPEPDAGLQYLASRGVRLVTHRPYLGDPLPALDDGAIGIIVLGGMQMVTEAPDLPWMQAELSWINDLISRQQRGEPDVPALLGICLGAQLTAAALGAKVGPHPDGVMAWGYYETHATKAESNPFSGVMPVLAGNAQGFDLPAGAELLAHGDMWPNQAFRVGAKTICTQFHPEVTPAIYDSWKAVFEPYASTPGTQSIKEQDAGHKAFEPALKEWFTNLLETHFALASHLGPRQVA